MEIKIKNKELNSLIGKFQQGGVAPEATPVEEPVAPEQGGGSPEEQLLMACQQALETQDCNLAMQVIQAVMQMIGGGAPAPAETQPVYKKGGILVRRIPKN